MYVTLHFYKIFLILVDLNPDQPDVKGYVLDTYEVIEYISENYRLGILATKDTVHRGAVPLQLWCQKWDVFVYFRTSRIRTTPKRQCGIFILYVTY